MHLTNYSIQKHNYFFSKFEKGNEVSFADFQIFLDKKHKLDGITVKELINKNSLIRNIINNMILSKEKISRNQKLWQSIFLQLLRNNVTLNDNFLKSLIKLSERDEHESYKILLVNIILLALFDKF